MHSNTIKKLSVVFLFIASAIIFFAFTAEPQKQAEEEKELECTTYLIGRLATVDGSTITSHTCDSRISRTWMNIVPNMKYKPGELAKVYVLPKETTMPNQPDRKVSVEIPQVAETYQYLNAAYPIMNEHQLAIGESTFGGKEEMKSDSGKIDCPELYRLCLERAKTAREAIKVIDELTKKYGYNDAGECFTFSDPKEVWYFEIVGPGKGKVGAVWAAIRIPDDEAAVNANASRIRQLNLNDKENCMASDNIYTAAEELGLWNRNSGVPFEFCYVYADRNSMVCRRREWRALMQLAPSLKLDANAENYPLSVKVEKKVSAKDVVNFFRDYYQGTPYDMTAPLMVVDKDGKATKSPVASPFANRDLLALLKVNYERTIACVRATYVQVSQSRGWLPNEIGGLVWLGYDNPMATPHTPFYIGNLQMPKSYMVDGRKQFTRDCAWWAYRQVAQLALFRWQEMIKDIEPVWQEIENKVFEDQLAIEAKALEQYKVNPLMARKYLTKYSNEIADKAVERYWKLGEELWVKYTQKF